jgi:proteasome alpha subunit
MFSPDGRLFQVDYAREAVRKGATSVGLIAEDGVVLLAHKNIQEPLAIPSTVQKIFRVDSFVGATYSGLVSDGLHIINIMRHKTQSHRMIYDETESIETISREIAEEMQMATQYGGIRPYAVSVLVAGYGSEPKLFEIDAGASFLGYKADAIGSGKKTAEDILVKEYKDDMSIDEAVKLGVSVVKKVAEGKLTSSSVDIAKITKKDGYVTYSQEMIGEYL